jgi:hypothetical protein
MRNNRVPRFTADASIYLAVGRYRTARADSSGTTTGAVIPALGKSCGGCSELKWPNGTGTGACVRDCCSDIPSKDGWQQRCQFEACACPITSASLGWFTM